MDIELSLMGSPARIQEVRELIQSFEKKHYVHVNITYQRWDTAWSGMVRSSIEGKSPTVSEVGTSWVPDLVGMNTLHPLSPSIQKQIGSAADYVPQSWQSCFLPESPQMWAAPWLSGTRIIYYRKDLLAAAGVDPSRAFVSPQTLLSALEQLRSAGITCPWITSTVESLNALHLASTWVWAAGGDFISGDGREILFASEKSINGLSEFYRMGRYMGPDPFDITYESAVELFWRGSAAITMDGSWMYDLQKDTAYPEVIENIGFAIPPGPAFVGGSNLVIWTNTHQKEIAEKLMLFMSEPESVRAMVGITGLSPARRELLVSNQAGRAELEKIVAYTLQTGRSLPNLVFSAMIEDKLHRAFGHIWADVLSAPNEDPRDLITQRLVPLKNRIEASLS
jgi:multiple sugar transport system substrate-binding protein